MSVRTKLRRMFGDKTGLETHHIVPSYKGGTDDPSNVVTLTVRDHMFAHMLYAKAYSKDSKAWASLWAIVGMPRKNRSIKNVLKNKWVYVSARKEMADNCVGEKSKNANITVYEWVNAKTGEEFTGTRHDLVKKAGHTNSAKWEAGDYFRGIVMTTRSGWFEKTRFASIDALNLYKESIKNAARKASKEKNSGKNSVRATKVICVDTGIVYNTQRDAANDTGALQAKISQCCNGTRKSTKGYRWAFYKETA